MHCHKVSIKRLWRYWNLCEEIVMYNEVAVHSVPEKPMIVGVPHNLAEDATMKHPSLRDGDNMSGKAWLERAR